MGFVTGFTGGVTLTLSVAYLSVLAHQRHRERQAAILRQQTRLLSAIIDPLLPVLPPTRAERAAADRANFIERAKDRWNSEIEDAVHWVQNKDWEETRENVEIALARLWARAFGDAQGPAEKVEDVAANAKAVVNEKLDQGKEKAASVAAAAKSAYADAKAKGSEVVVKTEEKAQEAKGSFLSRLWGAKDTADKAKSAVVEGAKQKGNELSSQLSEEERVLNQRYQGSTSLNQSPDEVLAARYTSAGQQDKSQLKAL
ncbi:uncharacterized protein F4812DRAFT_428826 [Daldinia caldariorum]|uniref:uncharacterized protein n=1 Tax=Daldinia caldariorum TaxID=326644 RepID=UPI0020085074|nr:uncharacterized protein F4812DRAFT_428826 [Daldinia caldariorum]KAI1468091.1 hypothetical protein F4812DRAFT_428826 [Daldinia caldariorum]